MNIICHRGYWKKKKEQNHLKACLEGLEHFQGIEIDLKNKNGKIVLSHDPLEKGQNYIKLEDCFSKHPGGFYALNIKEDGLSDELAKLIQKYKIKNYMCFDLSTPESIQYKNKKLIVYDRMGDQDPQMNYKTGGIVVDIFSLKNMNQIFKQIETIKKKHLFFISPELHQLSHRPFWNRLKAIEARNANNFSLCTDYPEEANAFFNNLN